MTTAEACAFLGIDSAEDAEDAFEEAVFAIRQQLIAGPALYKTTESRCKRLQQLDQAYSALTGIPPKEKKANCEPEVFADRFTELFTTYHTRRNQLRRLLAGTFTVSEIIGWAECLLELERSLAHPFSGYEDWGEAPVVIGRDTDPMDVLHWLREQEQKGLQTLSDLYENKNNLPPGLLSVLKRLSLLKKYLYP